MQSTMHLSNLSIAVLVPCYNEEASVAEVVRSFMKSLPTASIFVYDNNSTDETAARARAAGAIVRTEKRQGKGNVVRRMFADIEADVYVMVDGDNTYDAASAPRLIEELMSGPYDKVNGARVAQSQDAYRSGHRFGNWALTQLVSMIFGKQTKDMLSGYKVMSRRFVKSFPVASSGFEIETELLVHALELRVPMSEVDTPYVERGEGSHSKLSTYRDGFRILRLIAHLIKNERPLPFFMAVAAFLAMLGIGFGAPVILEFLETGLVPRLPTAILSMGFVLAGMLSCLAGFVLDGIVHVRREAKALRYLSIPAPLAAQVQTYRDAAE